MTQSNFLLIGSFGGANLGDNAVLDTIIQLIDSKYSAYKVYIPTSNVDYIKKKYYGNERIIPININIRTGAIRFTSFQTMFVLFKVNKVITTAGILFDYDTIRFLSKNFITTLIPLLTVAKIFKKEIIGLNVGIVQKSAFGKYLLKFILNKHDIIYLREPEDRKILSRLNVNTKAFNSADVVFLNKFKKKTEIIKPDTPILGVNLNKYIDEQSNTRNKVSYNEFIRIVARNLDEIISKFSSKIIFFPTAKMDIKIHLDVKRIMENHSSVKLLFYENYVDLLEEISKIHILIGMRMHSLIFATLQGKPVCSLNYNPKVTGFMKQLGLTTHSHEIYDLNQKTLFNSINEILNNYDYYTMLQSRNNQDLAQKAKLSQNSL